MIITLLVCLVQEETAASRKSELLKLWKEKFDKIDALEHKAVFTRARSFGASADEEGTLTVKVSLKALDEEHPPAVRTESRQRFSDGRIEEVVTLVRRQESIVAYPRERVAYVYDLGKRRNTPWEIFFLLGLGDDLERIFELEVLKAPAKGDGEVVTRDGDGRGGFVGEERGGDRGVRVGGGKGPLTENVWMASLTPKDRHLKKEITEFVVYLDPETLHPRYIDVRTPAEFLRVTFQSTTVPEQVRPEDVVFPLDNYRIKDR